MAKIILRVVFLVLILVTITNSLQTNVHAADNYSNWISDNQLPYNSSGNQNIIINNSLYTFGGGDNSVYHQDIISSNILGDGSLSSWISRGQLPDVITWHTITNRGNDIYLLGGAKPDPNIPIVSSVDWVYHSKIDALGNVGPWSPETNLPIKLARGGAFVYNNRLYYVGGLVRNTNSTENVVGDVYFSSINPDGSLSGWSQIDSLPQPRAEFALFLNENYIYVTAGMQSNTQPANTIYMGTIDQNSGLISWSFDSNTPVGLRRPAYTKRGKVLYLIGGYDGTSFTSDTYTAEITLDNSIGLWSLLNITLPFGSCCNSAVSSNTSLYTIGGHNGGSYFPDVLRSDISSSTFSIPNLKQYDPLWKNLEYDTANLWSNNPTIERWGCALTSAAMVLQTHGHNIFPDALNSWLKLQADGYLRNGLLNWLAISRYTKLHDTNTSPTLEYRRFSPDSNILIDELSQSRPAILGLPGHYVVATGENGSDFSINDPATSKSLLSEYGGNFLSINSYKPTHTDLSYIMLVTNSNISLKIFDENENQVGESFTEQALIDDVGGISKSGDPINILLVPVPDSQKYKIKTEGPDSSYTLSTYLYSEDGEVQVNNFKSLSSQDSEDEFFVDFSKSGGSVVISSVTVNSTLQDLNSAWLQGLIKPKTVYNLLKKELELSGSLLKKNNKKAYKALISQMIKEVKGFTPKYISKQASEVLLQDLQSLLSI